MSNAKSNISAGLLFLTLSTPLGILAEVLLSASPIFVIGGGLSIVLAMGWLSFAVWQSEIHR